jgi:hypothetical protein
MLRKCSLHSCLWGAPEITGVKRGSRAVLFVCLDALLVLLTFLVPSSYVLPCLWRLYNKKKKKSKDTLEARSFCFGAQLRSLLLAQRKQDLERALTEQAHHDPTPSMDGESRHQAVWKGAVEPCLQKGGFGEQKLLTATGTKRAEWPNSRSHAWKILRALRLNKKNLSTIHFGWSRERRKAKNKQTEELEPPLQPVFGFPDS